MRPAAKTFMHFTLLAALSAGCSAPLAPVGDVAIDALPLEVPAPAASPTTDDRVALGRALFWDPILSGDRDVACATCHHPAFGFADGRTTSLGAGGRGLGPARVATSPLAAAGRRNAPSVLNAAWNGLLAGETWTDPELAPMFWDAREASLEAQARGPLHSAQEMRGYTVDDATLEGELSRRLGENAEYVGLFERAFGDAAIDETRITRAIASYERTLVAPDTSFDRFLLGDPEALDLSQKRGLIAFYDAGCATCHAGPMFSDFELHHLGIEERDPGSGATTDAFRTPSLRGVTHTAPYMHDGSVATLEAVIVFYRNVDRGLDEGLAPLQPVGARQTTDLLHFLEALSDGTVDESVPERVPSGLAPGGS